MKTVKCRKNLTGKLVEECHETIDEKELHQNKMVYNWNLNGYQEICSSCITISSVLIYFHW